MKQVYCCSTMYGKVFYLVYSGHDADKQTHLALVLFVVHGKNRLLLMVDIIPYSYSESSLGTVILYLLAYIPPFVSCNLCVPRSTDCTSISFNQ